MTECYVQFETVYEEDVVSVAFLSALSFVALGACFEQRYFGLQVVYL